MRTDPETTTPAAAGAFTADAWPASCGFVWDAKNHVWTRGDYRLKRVTWRAWKLYAGPGDRFGRLVTTLRRSARAVAESLAMKLREMTREAPEQ